MRVLKTGVLTIFIGLLLMACNSSGTDETTAVDVQPSQPKITETEPLPDDYWARDNLDLQRVGTLIERSENVEDFERSLNSRDGINNLDLNGDGYVDYISVDEFGDNYDDERGITLYSRFGPDLIQEIATIIFNRNGYNTPGARILLRGNEQIYGDNYYYETNWVDRSLDIVTSLFGDRNMYRSPYYYDNYPSYYEPYEVVQPTIYVSRIQQLYPTPVFIQVSAPAYQKVKIRSPYEGKWMDKVYAKMAKPTKEQMEFRKEHPNKPAFSKVKGDKKNDGNDDVAYDKVKPDKPDKADKQNDKPYKVEKLGPPVKTEDQKPPKAEKQNNKPAKQGGNGKGKKD
jgi:hypothetical protein